MKVIELINSLKKLNQEEEIFISYSDEMQVLVPLEVGKEQGILDQNYASAFIYVEEIEKTNDSLGVNNDR